MYSTNRYTTASYENSNFVLVLKYGDLERRHKPHILFFFFSMVEMSETEFLAGYGSLPDQRTIPRLPLKHGKNVSEPVELDWLPLLVL